MAWSSADIPAAERTLFAADKPVLVGVHALESPQVARWDADGSLAGGSDISATDWPATRSYDRLTGLRTKSTGAVEAPAGTWTAYLCWQLAASPKDIDCIFILDHNLGTIGGLTVTAEIDDANTFASATFKVIKTWTPGTSNKRLAAFDLNHSGSGSANAQRYAGVPFFRIKMTKGSSFTPEIGEVWAGRRRQLRYDPGLPWDNSQLRSEVVRHTTRSGITTSSVRFRGQRVLDARFNPDAAADHTDLKTWFQDINHGSRPFVWCQKPSSAPSDFHVMLLNEPELVMPYQGPFEREVTIRALENGPDFLDLGT